MQTWLVERHLPGITPQGLTEAVIAAKTSTAEMRDEGIDIHYLRSTFLPVAEKCYCLFEATTEQEVAEANRRAELPYERISEAMMLSGDTV